jgi:Na+-driven multidrug efflux pump
MEPAKRILINTIAQYTKAIINTVLSLYTVRLILHILGQSDYGIMSVVGSIVGLLGFMTNALVVTTQRQLSFEYGKGNHDKTRRTFSNCFLLHLGIGVSLLVLLLSLEPLIVTPQMLNINAGRWEATHAIYKIVSFILFTTFLTAPFKALLIARENIIFISIIEVLDGFFKLAMALALPLIPADKLIVYGFIMLSIMLFEFIVFSLFDIANYPECSPRHFFADYNIGIIQLMSGFAGWTTYSMGAIAFRNQGIAWLINRFFGTVVNAAYGIANQLFSAFSFISSSVINAMNPQLMKAEGKGDHHHMLSMAEHESRIIVCMMSIVFIPLMIEIDGILDWWLVDVPPYTVLFSDTLLIMFLLDQFTTGLTSANQAMGRIRNYSLIMYTPQILIVPFSYVALKLHWGLYFVMGIFIATQILVTLARLPFMHHRAGLNIGHFVRKVFVGNLCLILLSCLLSIALRSVSDWQYRFFITLPIDILGSAVMAWLIVFNKEERSSFIQMIFKKR